MEQFSRAGHVKAAGPVQVIEATPNLGEASRTAYHQVETWVIEHRRPSDRVPIQSLERPGRTNLAEQIPPQPTEQTGILGGRKTRKHSLVHVGWQVPDQRHASGARLPGIGDMAGAR